MYSRSNTFGNCIWPVNELCPKERRFPMNKARASFCDFRCFFSGGIVRGKNRVPKNLCSLSVLDFVMGKRCPCGNITNLTRNDFIEQLPLVSARKKRKRAIAGVPVFYTGRIISDNRYDSAACTSGNPRIHNLVRFRFPGPSPGVFSGVLIVPGCPPFAVVVI